MYLGGSGVPRNGFAWTSCPYTDFSTAQYIPQNILRAVQTSRRFQNGYLPNESCGYPGNRLFTGTAQDIRVFRPS